MAQKTLDDIRKLLDPQGYLDGMEEVKQALVKNRTRLFVNLDLNKDAPNLSPEERTAALDGGREAIFDCQWRIDEIERRVEDAKDAAQGGRAAKRRRAKAEK